MKYFYVLIILSLICVSCEDNSTNDSTFTGSDTMDLDFDIYHNVDYGSEMGVRKINLSDGSNELIIEDANIFSSPSNGKIAYVKDYSVYLSNTDGSDPRLIQDGSESYCSFAIISPDANYFAFAQTNYSNLKSVLYIKKTTGTDLKKVADLKSDFLLYSFSPDCKKIAFIQSDEDGIFENFGVYDIEKETSEIFGGHISHYSGLLSMPSWSPDGSKVVFPASDISNTSIAKLMLADVNNKTLKTISTGDIIAMPEFSPLGNKIAFIKGVRTTGKYLLVKIGADGSNEKTLLSSESEMNFFMPHFHKDGRNIIVQQYTDSNTVQKNLYRVNIETEKFEFLLDNFKWEFYIGK